jgi:DNA-binding GntR family transcriptional regulator
MSVAFPRIEPVTLSDKIVAMLKEAFFSGKLKPGDLIVERELARQVNSGTPAVREALITLQEQGFVQRIVNKGTYVTRFCRDEVEQLYLLRTELELLALRWAKPRVTETDLVALERTVDGIIEAAANEDPRLSYDRDLAFHRQCWELSGNKFLSRALENIVGPLFAFVQGKSPTGMTEADAREHLNIVDALRSLKEPDFSSLVRSTLSGFAIKNLSAMTQES